MAPPHSLITIPPEICRLILESLSSSDLTALRQVSSSFNSYFTGEDLCGFAQKLYFPLSSEARRTQRSRSDLDAAYLRSQRWKHGCPSHVEVIDEVAAGLTSASNGFLVDPEAGLLAYQQSRGLIILKNLKTINDDTTGPDIFIDLQEELGPCMMLRSDNIFLRDGESIRIDMNRGMLLVIGEAHIHNISNDRLGYSTHTPKGFGIMSTLWNLAWGTSEPFRPIPSRGIREPPHTMCAVFSTKPHDRGKLIHAWFARDSFIMETALNEFYAITEFDLVEQRLEGCIYPTIKPSKQLDKQKNIIYNREPQDGKHEGHYFTIKKKSLYPALSTFTISSDTRGKVFYLGFLPPSADRRPVVEVHSVPQFNPVDSTWSECTVIKRVTLRSLGRHAGGMNGSILNSSFWIAFDVGTTVKNLKGPKIEPSGDFARDPDEDIVRIRMKGDLFIPGITTKDEQVIMATWDITARPSPLLPSTITEWRQGQEWALESNDNEVDLSSVSLYQDAQGRIDFEDVYPSPTYYLKLRKREEFLAGLVPVPVGVDLDRLEANNGAGIFPPLFWIKEDGKKNKTVCSVYGVMDPDTVILNPEHESDGGGMMSPLPPHDAVVYPMDPGRNDKDFVPAGRLMRATYMIVMDTGRKVVVPDIAKTPDQPPKRRSKFWGKFLGGHHAGAQVDPKDEANVFPMTKTVDIPLPGFDDARDRVITHMDAIDKKYWVYGKEGTEVHRNADGQEEKFGDKIVIVRFDSAVKSD